MDYKMMDQDYIANTYKRFDILLVKGQGSRVYDEKGKEYLDFTSGIGVTSLGHGHELWIATIIQQVTQLTHVSNLYYSKPMVDLAQKLCQRTQMKKVFFANSGAEANEGCIKLARKYGRIHYPHRNEIITLRQSFHGRTITTLSATGQDHFHQDFHPFTQGFKYIEVNNIEDLSTKVNDQTLAIMIEIIQGEGGVITLSTSFLHQIQKICDTKDILLIIDEVQTGIGRTGTLFAYMHENLHPDIVSVAKGLGNGLPIGAILIGEKCQDIFQYGDHGTTFGGNLVSCAGANVVMDIVDDAFLEEVKEKGRYMKKRLNKMKHVLGVDGRGMMVGVLLDIDVQTLLLKGIDIGLLCLSAKTKLRLLPPLTMTLDEIKAGMDKLEMILNTWGNEI